MQNNSVLTCFYDSQMFFINYGKVEIVSEDGEVVFALMKGGHYFGMHSLLSQCPRTSSVRAATNCSLFVLNRDDLYHAMSYYPHIEKKIRKVAGKRVELAKKRSLIAAQAQAEGMTSSDAAREAAKHTQDGDSEIYHPLLRKTSKSSEGSDEGNTVKSV